MVLAAVLAICGRESIPAAVKPRDARSTNRRPMFSMAVLSLHEDRSLSRRFFVVVVSTLWPAASASQKHPSRISARTRDDAAQPEWRKIACQSQSAAAGVGTGLALLAANSDATNREIT